MHRKDKTEFVRKKLLFSPGVLTCYNSTVCGFLEGVVAQLIRHEPSRHFRNKKKAYLKAKIEDFETNSKIKNIRDLYGGISEFKRVTSLELI